MGGAGFGASLLSGTPSMSTCIRCGKQLRPGGNQVVCNICGFPCCSEKCFNQHFATHPVGAKTRFQKKLMWGGALVGMLLVCSGALNCIDAAKKEDLAEADRLYEKGKAAEAVEKYKGAYSIAGDRKGEVLDRIVGHEVQKGDQQEARKWVEKGFKEGVGVKYTNPVAQRMLTILKKEQADKLARQQAERQARDQAKRRNAELNRIIGQLGSTNIDEQVAAAKELGRYRDRKAIRALAHAFTGYNYRGVDPEARVSQAASAALRHMGMDAVPELVEMLNDPKVQLRDRFNAATAIENIEPPPTSAVPGLRQAFKDPDLKSTAAGLLAKLVPGDREVLQYLLRAAQGEEDTGDKFTDAVHRAAALYSLGRMGSTAREALPVIRAALKHPEASVRQAATVALKQIGN